MPLGPQEWLAQIMRSEEYPSMRNPDPRAEEFERQMMLEGSRSEMPVDEPRWPLDNPPMAEGGYTDEQSEQQPDIERIMREMGVERRLDYNHPEQQQQDLINQMLGKPQQIAAMQGLPPEPQPQGNSNIMQYLSMLADHFALGAPANEQTEDRIFGTYGYDPDDEERESYATGLPPIGAGRYQLVPPAKSFGLDPDLKIFDDMRIRRMQTNEEDA